MENKTDIAVTHDKTPPAAATRPWEPFASLREQIDRLFNDFDWPDFRFAPRRVLTGFDPVRNWADLGSSLPAVDLVEHDGSYELQAELPGLDPGKIEVKLSDGMMTIKGEKSASRVEDMQDYHLRERSYGAFQRSFRLPSGIDAEKVSATFDKGVLTVTLPKSAEAREKDRKIEVKAA
jgi:HSP20 family protein